MPTTRKTLPDYIPELDGVRGLAILMVVIYHYVAVPIPPDAGAGLLFIRQIFGNNWSGVDLFFVLSGFLICGILLDNRRAKNYFKVFYIRRTTRIFPLYYLFLLIFILLQHYGGRMGLLSESLFASPLPVAPYFLYLQNFYMAVYGTFGNEILAPTWSLAIEEHFYLLLPLLVWISPPKRLPVNMIFLLMLTLILRAMVGGGTFVGFVVTPWRLDALLLGALLAVLFRNRRLLSQFESRQAWIKIALGILSLFLLYDTLTEPLGSLNYLFLFALLYSGLIFLTLADHTSRLSRFFRSTSLIHLGRIAYGVYIFHQLVNGVMHDLFFRKPPSFYNLPTMLVTLLAALVTYLIARFSYLAYEKHFINYGHKFGYQADYELVRTGDMREPSAQ